MCFALMNTSRQISEGRVVTIAVGPKVSRGIRETEEMEEFTGSIQCNIRTEELPPQHAEVIYYDSRYVE